jgi:hypothetical protein
MDLHFICQQVVNGLNTRGARIPTHGLEIHWSDEIHSSADSLGKPLFQGKIAAIY